MRALVVLAVAAAALGALAACSDPTFDVHITYERLGGAEEDELPAHVATLTVSVIDAEAAGPAAGLTTAASCEDVALGRIPQAVLEGARRASVGALDTPRISGVPRLGAKLVIAEARDEGGRRTGGGCTAVGDVESDASVDVEVEIAPRVRVFTREEIAAQPSPVAFVVTAPWNDLLPLPGREGVAELHTPTGQEVAAIAPTTAAGITRTPDLMPDEPGPAQTVVRVRWAEPIRVPGFVQWPYMKIDPAIGQRISLLPDDGARLGPSWIAGISTVAGVTAWRAAALQKPLNQPEELLVVRFADGFLTTATVPTPGARSVALWNRRVYTLIATGWREVVPGGYAQVPGETSIGSGPATEMYVFDGCEDAPGAGLIVRREGANMTDEFHAYSAPGVPAMTGDSLATLAAMLDPATHEIIGQACVDLDGTKVRIIATRGNAAGIIAWPSAGNRFILPGVQNATSFERDGVAYLAGVEGTISGPRVGSYKLTNLPIDTMTQTGFVAVDIVDTELATLPLSFAVHDVDRDDRYDVLAVLPGLTGPRIQANFGRLVAGEQLVSVSPQLPGGRGATRPILRVADVDAQGREELVVMTDEGIDVLCFDVRTSASGMECASAR